MPQGGESSSPRKRKRTDTTDAALEPQPSTSAHQEIPLVVPKPTGSNRDVVSLPPVETLTESFDNYRLDCYVQLQSIEDDPVVFQRHLLKLLKQEQKRLTAF